MDSWFHFHSGPGEPAWNMALDAALLETVSSLGTPVLRFYSWSQSAASFGYFQKYLEVAALTSLRPLVRRPTGGGLVPHDADWTYSVAVPPAHEWYNLSAIQSYRRMHEWVAAALREIGLDARLAPSGHAAGAGQCFVGHEQFDILAQGKKVAGAAQRRRREGLLIQGSVQPLVSSLKRGDWEHAMLTAGTREYGCHWTPFSSGAELRERVLEFTRDRYGTKDYNERR